MRPGYIQLAEDGRLEARVAQALEALQDCVLCPRRCHANRTRGVTGYCRTGRYARVANYGPHFGEERPLVGTKGSGTIFFSNCNLRCVYCQNCDISQLGKGTEMCTEELSATMLRLQQLGCHNINLVSPSHTVAQILEAVLLATQHGLSVPLVYNTGGYDRVDTLQLLDGVVDIYMPDMKYSDVTVASRLSDAHDYPEINRAAVQEMYRQVGDLRFDEQGLAERGLLVRHLVLPHDLAGTRATAEFLATSVSTSTYINVMPQYRPCFRASEYPELSRRITPGEYEAALTACRDAGLSRFE